MTAPWAVFLAGYGVGFWDDIKELKNPWCLKKSTENYH
jgi:glycerol kinase